jgi:branched-chain amino acid transport system substrate-binding protein
MKQSIGRRELVRGSLAAGTLSALPLHRGRAASPTVKIGVLTALTGPYSSGTGEGSVVAAKLAVDDFMKLHPRSAPPFKVEIVPGDMRDSPDISSALARSWFDTEGVDAITDIPNSAVALAVANLARAKDKAVLISGAGTTALTGEQCSPNTVQWTYDTYAQAKGTGKTLVQQGGDTWYFITADYAFGHSLENETTRFIKEAGGRVLGTSAFPFPDTTDFSAFLVSAQASRAKVVGIAAAGGSVVNCVKQAAEFGIVKGGQRLAVLLLLIGDLHGLGLDLAQGLVLTDACYWDMNDGTRAFAKRFAPQYRDQMPGFGHAGVYSVVLHYLKSVQALGVDKATASGRAAVEQMKRMPTDDPLFGKGSIRVDGRGMHNMYVWQVKTPAESKYPWDYYKLLQTIPAEEAFRPLSEGKCAFVPA